METGKVIEAAIAYFENDIRRISHLLKVYGFAKAIGEKEQLDLFTMECLETAAVLHDIGIKISEEKYQSSAGKYQELEGPRQAVCSCSAARLLKMPTYSRLDGRLWWKFLQWVHTRRL